VLDEDAAHRLGRGVEEMSPVRPPERLIAKQAQVRLMDQGGGLKGVPGALLGHTLLRDGAELGIHKLEQLIGGAGSTRLHGSDQPRDVSVDRDSGV
jgi:hypothetical protein